MKIRFRGECCVTAEHADANKLYTATLGLPAFRETASHPALAIVGGGPSINSREDEIRSWEGEIWAINGAYRWCRDRGISAAYISADPLPIVGDIEVASGDRVLLASYSDPSVFARLGGNIEVFEVLENEGPTTVAVCLRLALNSGFKRIAFFGCESSFQGSTHGYPSRPDYRPVILVCSDGEEFRTSPVLLLQAELLANMIRMFPQVFEDHSGGLLGAMARTMDYDITAIPRHMLEEIEWNSCPQTT